MNKFARLYILISWTFAIFILISFPTPKYIGTEITLQDKFLHAFLFGIFAWLVFYVLSGYRINQKKPKFNYFFSFFIGSAYSFFGEYLQNFIPGRTVSIYDSMAGISGIIIILIFTYVRERKKP